MSNRKSFLSKTEVRFSRHSSAALTIAAVAVVGTILTFIVRADATITSVKSGSWSSASTWSGNRVPTANDEVAIAPGHDVLYDIVDTKIHGMTVNGTLTFDPNKTVKLDTNANVVVNGQLVMVPKNATINHTLKFVEVNEAAFVGGGMDVLPTDVGLWVMGNGQLYMRGDQKRAWTNAVDTIAKGATQLQLVDASGWKVGDRIIVSPTHQTNFRDNTNNDGYNAFHEATITAVNGNSITINTATTREHPKVNGKWTSEVMNISRNVDVTSQDYTHKAHIFIRSTKPQFIRHTEISYMAPGQVFDEGYQARGQVLGRYGLHFHHSLEGSRGSIVEGTSLHHIGFRGYVPHESSGVTFRDTVAYDIAGGAYWWDGNFEKAHDTMWDRTIAAKVTTGEGAYYMGSGDNVELKNSVAVGISAGGATGGIEWENGQDGSWEFNNNIVHNVSGIGLRIWQNTSVNHIVSNFAVYHSNSHGIELGAYTNDYHFRNFEIYKAGEAGIRLLAVPRGVSVVVENGVIDGGDASTGPSISIGESAVPGNADFPLLIRNVTLKGRAKQASAAAVMVENATNDKKVDLVNITLESPGPATLVNFNANATGGSLGDGQVWVRVQSPTESYILRPANQNLDAGAVSVNNGNAWKTNIPKFRPEVWGNGTGLLSEYYDDLALTKKIYTGIDPYVRFVKEDNPIYHLMDNKDSAVRYSARVMPQYTGRYEFITEVTKERLWVNGQKIIDTWSASGSNSPVSGFIDLQAGQLYDLVFEAGYPHEIKPGQFNATFYAALDWKQPGTSRAYTIDLSQLYLPTGIAHSPFTLNDIPIASEPTLPSYVSGITPTPTPVPPPSTPPSTPPTDVDMNGDGRVNVVDLSILLSKWGTNDATADINNDGIVNVLDLSRLLARWG